MFGGGGRVFMRLSRDIIGERVAMFGDGPRMWSKLVAKKVADVVPGGGVV
jgi:hypothetical protein